jgi:hypothetical protein
MSWLNSCFGKSCIEKEDEDFDVFLKNNPKIAEKYAKRMAANKVREEKEVNKIIQSVNKEVAEEKKKNDEDAKFQADMGARLFNLKAPSPPKGGNKSIKKSIKRKKTRRNKSIKRKNIRRNKSIKRKKTRSKTRSIKY